jgi:hypothetical protein
MKKLAIEIENIADKNECIRALQKLFVALEQQYGEGDAEVIWRCNIPIARVRTKGKLSTALGHFSPEDGRLVLEYFAMPKPSKTRLAVELARKNEELPTIDRYGPKGTTDQDVMLQQIKRVFRYNKEACQAIGEAPIELRKRELRMAEIMSRMRAEMRAAGIRIPLKSPWREVRRLKGQLLP